MSKRKWVNIGILGAKINAIGEAGKTRQEIADHFGLDKVQIKNWINRHNKEVKCAAEGITPQPKGHPHYGLGLWPYLCARWQTFLLDLCHF